MPWWPTRLADLIRSPVYRGHYWMTRAERDPVTGKVVWSEKWEHSCEALIDARRFRLANEALLGREKRGPRGEPQTRAMLKGAIKCPDCEGSSMNKLTCRASSKHGGGTYTYYRCTGTGSRRKGCGNMVRMEVVDAAVDEIMATTFRVPVKRLILVKGTDYQDQLEEISYRIRALDPDVMSDEQFDEQVRRLRAERDRLKALPAEPDRWEEQLTGDLYADIYQALPASERGAWLDLARVRGPRHEEGGQRDPGGRERDSSPRVSSDPFILLAAGGYGLGSPRLAGCYRPRYLNLRRPNYL